jgi:hypothetical protein
MATQDKDREPQVPSAETPKQRRPYTKPSFRFENVFETMALSCGKVEPTQAGCKLNRKTS